MNRDNNGRFIKTNNDAMKLAIGDKITSCSQFREGMIVSFDAHTHNGIRNKWIHITNAIMVKDKDNKWFACHDNSRAIGNTPFFAIFVNKEYNDQKQREMMFDKEYSWQICFNEGMEDTKDTIFCGFYMAGARRGQDVDIEKVPTPKEVNKWTGWECPRCHKINAPFIESCNCSV